MKNKYLYHGSPFDLDFLKPHPSNVVNNEKVVFATNKKTFALLFLSKWSGRDFDLSRYGNNLPLSFIELRPGALNETFDGKSGYIYKVDGSLFASDDRLGMKNNEFIAKKRVPIIKKEFVKDILKSLKKRKDIIVIDHDTYSKMLRDGINKMLK